MSSRFVQRRYCLPDEVTKVEFINVPGLKYGDSNLDAVINYQVRRRYAGYVGGVSTMQGTKYNADICAKLGLTPPEGYEAIG